MKKHVTNFVLAGMLALVLVSSDRIYIAPTEIDSTYTTTVTNTTLYSGVSAILYFSIIEERKAIPYAGVAFLKAADSQYCIKVNDITVESETPEIMSSPIETEEVIEEPTEAEETTMNPVLTDEEIELLAVCTLGEAEVEPELAQRLVIDTILNRLDSNKFPNTLYDVIWQPHQFSAMYGKRIKDVDTSKCPWVYELIQEELESRTNSDVLYFRMNYYFDWAEPVLHSGTTYFSK